VTLYRPALREALLIQSGPAEDPERLHLHVVLTDICANGFHLVGPIASIRAGQFHDPTCVIHAGEHEFIRHDSFFVYRRLDTIAARTLALGIDSWSYRRLAPISEQLHLRICNAIAGSVHCPRRVKAYWRSNKPPGF
jgi:hypothetical protein